MSNNTLRKNMGPTWGFNFVSLAERCLPKPVFESLLSAGSCIATYILPEQKKHSQNYLSHMLGRPVRRRDIHQHFYAFAGCLADKLRLLRGHVPEFHYIDATEAAEYDQLCRSSETALFGTFHIGNSDLMGCMLSKFNRKVSIVRERVANSLDTDAMANRFAGQMQFIWVNDSLDFLFELKHAIDSGRSIGIQCDRLYHSRRTGSFLFLGKKRIFPLTIYHFSHLFQIPVAFAFAGTTGKDGRTGIRTSSVYRPVGPHPSQPARDHFQQVLTQVELHLKTFPYLWFNFEPLNPETADQ